ncbi:MAG: right-handed parallel beta-helix repeat-containing protein [Fimbriimonadaceae bacterium]|nr:right-handed parallel beta-helix repeat-containing protein [Fimbriimonadaceae bacterium]
MGRLLAALLLLPALASAAVQRPAAGELDALARAVAAAAAGDTIELAAGTYPLSAMLRLKSGLTVRGAGAEATSITRQGGPRAGLLELHGCHEVVVRDLTLDGGRRPECAYGLVATDSQRLRIEQIVVKHLAGEGWGPFGILFVGDNPTCARGVTDSLIRDCGFEDIGVGTEWGGAIRLAWGSNRNEVRDCQIAQTGRGGIFGDHSTDLVVRGNEVTGSGGVGLGIELWGGCHRSVVEDNVIDHWLSIDGGQFTAVRRNRIGTADGTLKFLGLEFIASDGVVSDNEVWSGQQIGLSVSNQPPKNNVLWQRNSVVDCNQWGAQFQGETGGAARHYFYRCRFEANRAGDPRAPYPNDSGHGFRTNGHCQGFVFEECDFRDNGGLGLQLGGPAVDQVELRRCRIQGNRAAALRGGVQTAGALLDLSVAGNAGDALPTWPAFATAAPEPRIAGPARVAVGEPATFRAQTAAPVEAWLWDCATGIPQNGATATHTWTTPGTYEVTLVVWSQGRGGRATSSVVVQ